MATYATFENRNVITFPASPAAASVEPMMNMALTTASSVFTGQQQQQSWAIGAAELTLTYPPLTAPQAETFQQFFINCQGVASVFTLPTWLAALVPTGLNSSTYWALKDNKVQFSVSIANIWGCSFSIRSVI